MDGAWIAPPRAVEACSVPLLARRRHAHRRPRLGLEVLEPSRSRRARAPRGRGAADLVEPAGGERGGPRVVAGTRTGRGRPVRWRVSACGRQASRELRGPSRSSSSTAASGACAAVSVWIRTLRSAGSRARNVAAASTWDPRKKWLRAARNVDERRLAERRVGQRTAAYGDAVRGRRVREQRRVARRARTAACRGSGRLLGQDVVERRGPQEAQKVPRRLAVALDERHGDRPRVPPRNDLRTPARLPARLGADHGLHARRRSSCSRA